MKKFLIKTFYYATLVFVLGNVVAFSANYFLKKSSFYKSSFLVNEFNSDKKLDYFVVGSSRGLTTLNSNLIDEKLGLKGVNLSMDDTDLKTQSLMIHHFFESNYKADYLVLVLDANHFKKTSLELGNNDYRFVPFIDRDYVKNHFKKYEKSTLNILTNSNYNPFFAYSYYNLELLLPATLSIIKPKFRNKFDKFGNYSYPSSGHENNNATFKIKEIDTEITNPIIKDIKNYLDENKCKLIIYIAPYQLEKFTFNNKLEYSIINSSSALVNKNEFFYDKIHVNNKGREQSTLIFINNFKLLIN
ncbi:hypothetical protein MPF19_12425 [Polaribacter sp. Z014]|uniref:hypothetical protein n=1 Tax=Polaribacter sp. Z014 TaxID=2927126 RepID=UPI002020248E|nr:hypothetical protein [Polaribacter sp. Z014]MCL7764224.1 hypothetical protein [Polaribacter sp. Z014]